jgi:hypothetical protein
MVYIYMIYLYIYIDLSYMLTTVYAPKYGGVPKMGHPQAAMGLPK